MQFYAYLWLRADGTPYYAGNGNGRRASPPNKHIYPPRYKTRRILFDRATEAEAFETERELIRNWGRKDLGTGCLRNRADGGEGAAGCLQSVEVRQRKSQTLMGHPVTEKSRAKARGNKYALGRHCSETTKELLRHLRTGTKASLETREKQRQKKI